MRICRFVFLIVSLVVSTTSQGGDPMLSLTESPELMHGYVDCQWDEAEQLRRFHFYTNLPTLYVASGGFNVSLPPESTDCDPALLAISDYFSETGVCQFWLENSHSAPFMCNSGKSDLVTIIYDVCELMTGF
jgi:hypothetical protein